MTFADEQALGASVGARADAAIADLTGRNNDLTTWLAAARAGADQLAQQVDALTPKAQQVDTLTATLTDVRGQLAAAQSTLAGVQADYAAYRQAHPDTPSSPVGPSAPTVPAGFVGIDTFAGATLADRLAVATGPVWVPPQGVWAVDADWTKDKRILVPIGKGVTRLRFAPGTTLRLNPGTSKYWTQAMVTAGATNPLSVIQQTSGQLVEWTGLKLSLTPQGHDYHGASLFNVQQPNGTLDVELVGGAGSGGANPKETFAVTLRGAVGWTVRFRGDGTADDGSNSSAVGLTLQRCLRCTITDDSTFANYRASTVVLYESANCTIGKAKMDRATTAAAGFGSGCHINLEQTMGTACKGTQFSGGVPGSDVTVSLACDQSTLTLGGESFTLNDATITYDDCTGGVSWPGSTKDGLICTRIWGQDVTLLDSTGKRIIGPLYAPGGQYASLGVTVDNVDAKGYPLLAGKHQGYAGKPAGVRRSPAVRRGGTVVPSWTSAYGKTLVGATGGAAISPG